MILITGGMGFIGLHTARSLLDAGQSVVITRYKKSRLPSFLSNEFESRLRVVDLDLSDQHATRAVLRDLQIKSIVHLAVPARSNLSPMEDLAGSVRSTLGLLTAALETGITRITAASSLAVYFDQMHVGVPLQEDMLLSLNARHPIEANKKIDEIMQSFLTSTGAISITRARIGMVWGPCYHSMLNAPSRLALLALKGPAGIEGLPDPRDAHPDDLLDLIYVRDCARALALLHTRSECDGKAYNVVSGAMVRYGDLVDAFNRAVPHASITLSIPDRAPLGSSSGYCDNSRLRAEIGPFLEYDLDSAVLDYINWLRENPS